MEGSSSPTTISFEYEARPDIFEGYSKGLYIKS